MFMRENKLFKWYLKLLLSIIVLAIVTRCVVEVYEFFKNKNLESASLIVESDYPATVFNRSSEFLKNYIAGDTVLESVSLRNRTFFFEDLVFIPQGCYDVQIREFIKEKSVVEIIIDGNRYFILADALNPKGKCN